MGFEEEALLLPGSRPQGNLRSALRCSGLRDGPGWLSPSGQGGVAPSGQGGYTAPYAAPQVFGAGQHAFQPAKPATIASVTEMTPAVPGGEEAPPAPEVKETSAIGAPTGGLLLPTPSGN